VDVVTAIGMDEGHADALDAGATLELLGQRLDALEKAGVSSREAFVTNARLLGAQLSLSPLEQDIVALTAVATMGEGLSDCMRAIAPNSLQALSRTVGCALGVNAKRVREAFEPIAPLMSARLIRVQLGSGSGFSEAPLELADPLREIFLRPHKDGDALLRAIFRTAARSEFGVDDFPHLAKDLPILLRFAKSAVAQGTTGVNILLHGPPGTGKTQLARVIAAHAGALLYEVSVEDDDGDARYDRLSAYALCQRALARRSNTMVLLDELEDAFPEPPMFGMRRMRRDGVEKGWLNRLLESNPIPTLWVGNAIDHIDPAFLRRFDFVMEVREPPPKVRKRMIVHHTKGLPVGDGWIEKVSGDRRVGPGHLERAAKVARVIGPEDVSDAEHILSRVLDASLETSVRGKEGRDELPSDFDLSYLNADCELPPLLDGLQRNRAGSICLFGPPGTGKTVFARHVASHLGMPLHARRASDLLGSFVGQTEAAIARMFSAATRDEAVLFLDEADSFLQDRRRARQSWEVTQVNELLVQMESFDGVFICATNLVDSFDLAAARRFALQIRFDPLTVGGAFRMLSSMVAGFGGEAPSGADRASLGRLTGLTPGDFAAVRKRLWLLGGEVSAGRVVDELAKESARKPACERAVGFRR
jgi:AAA+ superfamily predicted ATPase